MAAILVFQSNETAAMLVYQTSPVGVELFSYVNTFFCSNKFAHCWPREWPRSIFEIWTKVSKNSKACANPSCGLHQHFTVLLSFSSGYQKCKVAIVVHTSPNYSIKAHVLQPKLYKTVCHSFCTSSYWFFRLGYIIYRLLTKHEIKMAGCRPSSLFFACEWTETESRSISSQKKQNEANIQPS